MMGHRVKNQSRIDQTDWDLINPLGESPPLIDLMKLTFIHDTLKNLSVLTIIPLLSRAWSPAILMKPPRKANTQNINCFFYVLYNINYTLLNTFILLLSNYTFLDTFVGLNYNYDLRSFSIICTIIILLTAHKECWVFSPPRWGRRTQANSNRVCYYSCE